MKLISKVLTVLLLAVMVLSLLPNLNAPVSAASTAVLVLDSSNATAPILDHLLDIDTYGKGGPFTVTYEWKCNIKAISAAKPDAYASVQSIGTVYGSMQDQPESGIRISGNTNWTQVSYTFQNVGTYPMVGSNLPGNVFRFRLHDAKGQLYVKNLVIKNAAGNIVYNLNTDPVVNQLVDQMEINGMTQADMSELAAISFEGCPWVANQFETGKYTSYVILESGSVTTSSSITRPTTHPTTVPTTAPPTTTTPPTTPAPTTSSVTKNPTTKAPTTKAPTTSSSVVTTPEPTTVPSTGVGQPIPSNNPVVTTPNPTTVPTAAPTAAPTVPAANTNSGSNNGDNSLTLLLLVAIAMALIGCIAFIAIKLLKKD